MIKHICEFCGKEFETKKSSSKYCSRECYLKGRQTRLIDLTGKKFGKLTVIKRTENHMQPSGQRKTQWECICECGNKTIVTSDGLRNSHTQSCGCIAKKEAKNRMMSHGLSKTRLYKIYWGIKARCYNPNNNRYNNYGLRGIVVCDEWLDEENGFINFYNWSIENGYKNNLTIDRIDVNGNYEPSNCRWATNVEQANNRTSNHYITYNGKTQSLADWCRELNLDYSIISNRLNRYHWAVEQAFETPIKKTKERIL